MNPNLCPVCEFTEDGPREVCYRIAEREGIALDSAMCPECPDPGLCMAEGECCAGGHA